MCVQISPDCVKVNILLPAKFVLQIVHDIFYIVAAFVTLCLYSLISKINHKLIFIAVCILNR